MNSKKIVIVASECQPFFASGGLGDVIGSLPQKIAKLVSPEENQVSVILPLYSKFTNNKYRNKLVYIGETTVQLSWRRQYCGIYRYIEKGVTYYFLDNEYYFKHNNYYGYFNDGERFAFFSKAAIEVMAHLDIIPDIIHAHDWQTGLVPVYLRTIYYGDERFKNVRTVFTVHNIEYQGKQHYEPSSKFGGKKGFYQQVYNDNLKRRFCALHDFKLIEVPYTEENLINYDYLMAKAGY